MNWINQDSRTQPRSLAIGDYALIGDCTTAALVGCNGAIDWLCWPRFDSAACFARLLGNPNNRQWQIAPAETAVKARRAYRGASMILETEFDTAAGQIAIIDFMPVGESGSWIVRIVEGRRGSVAVRMSMTLRFDYGSTVPWVYRDDTQSGVIAIAGPNLAILRASTEMHGEGLSTVGDFTVAEGQQITSTLSYGQSHLPPPAAVDASAALRRTAEFWHSWSSRCTYHGPRQDAVIRSLLTLKALTFIETGGIVAAPTTSLPEQLGGSRNWDYRYCWIRDATLTLTALMGAGYYDEAKAWRIWLHRSLAGTPDDLQILYGISGERRLTEQEVPWLSGYRGASPVRVGNAASGQLQLDVWGEMMDALHLAREGGLVASASGWDLQCHALQHLESHWKDPDDGLWEVRSGRRQFTHSKVMAWVAFDRSIRDAIKFKLSAPLDRWHAIRDEIHRTVCEHGFDSKRNTFTQCFGGSELDAQSSESFWSMDSCCATAAKAGPMACRRAKASFWPAASGWRMSISVSADMQRRMLWSIACWRCATTSAY